MPYQFRQTGAEIQDILDQVGENTTDISSINTTLTNMYYNSGDSISGAFSVDGYITSGANQLILDLHLPKIVRDNTSMTLTSANFQYVRLGYGGYLPKIPTASNVASITARHGRARIVISGFATGATNNCVVGGEATVAITFN